MCIVKGGRGAEGLEPNKTTVKKFVPLLIYSSVNYRQVKKTLSGRYVISLGS